MSYEYFTINRTAASCGTVEVEQYYSGANARAWGVINQLSRRGLQPPILKFLDNPGVAGIWGPPDYGDPRPNITSDIGMGVTISLSDMRLPVVPIALAVWGSSVIWGSLALLYRAVGSNFQLVRPIYCDHNTAACNRQGVGVGGDVPPSARSAEKQKL